MASRDQEKGHRIPCPSLSIGNDSIKKSCHPPAALGVPFLSPVLTHRLAIQQSLPTPQGSAFVNFQRNRCVFSIELRWDTYCVYVVAMENLHMLEKTAVLEERWGLSCEN